MSSFESICNINNIFTIGEETYNLTEPTSVTRFLQKAKETKNLNALNISYNNVAEIIKNLETECRNRLNESLTKRIKYYDTLKNIIIDIISDLTGCKPCWNNYIQPIILNNQQFLPNDANYLSSILLIINNTNDLKKLQQLQLIYQQRVLNCNRCALICQQNINYCIMPKYDLEISNKIIKNSINTDRTIYNSIIKRIQNLSRFVMQQLQNLLYPVIPTQSGGEPNPNNDYNLPLMTETD